MASRMAYFPVLRRGDVYNTISSAPGSAPGFEVPGATHARAGTTVEVAEMPPQQAEATRRRQAPLAAAIARDLATLR